MKRSARAQRDRQARTPATAVIDALESRRMLNAATLKHGLLTVYGSDAADTITIADTSTPAAKSVTVSIDGQQFTFRGTGITRMRVFGFDGGDTITLGDATMPNITDIAIDAGDGNNMVTDASLGHKYNRLESVSLLGGAGNDTLVGGAHTFSSEGGAGNDTLYGGAPGAQLDGGDGNDIVAANNPTIANALLRGGDPNNAVGSIALSGGAGDDVIIGNNFQLANVTDTLSGGGDDDTFFKFSTDTIVDNGVGTDTTLGGNQFTPPATVNQTATLALIVNGNTEFPAQGVGNNGPNNRIVVTDASGTVTMQGPNGATFQLGDLLNAAGYPVSALGIPPTATLTVNGFPAALSPSQIPGYVINDGDVIQLTLS